MKVDIHNQCLDFKLTDQKCFSHGAYWNRYPVREVEADGVMSVEFKSPLEAFKGAVVYELRRKSAESTRIQLFVAWQFDGYKKFYAYAHLLECSESFSWNEIRLKKHYQRYTHQLNRYTSPIKNTWLIHDDTVLMTSLELTFVKRDSILNVTVSEGIKDDCTKKPGRINLER
jgi:hypothetical protein